jgi:hypothetical protein
VANVKKRRGRLDGGAKRYAVPVCLLPDRVMSPGTGRPVHIANKTRLLYAESLYTSSHALGRRAE